MDLVHKGMIAFINHRYSTVSDEQMLAQTIKRFTCAGTLAKTKTDFGKRRLQLTYGTKMELNYSSKRPSEEYF